MTPVEDMDRALSGFRRTLGMHLIEAGGGRAVLDLPLSPALGNSLEVAHGGVLAALVEAAGELSCHPRPAETITVTTNYLGNRGDGVLRAVGRWREGGRRIFSATVEVTDGTGRVLALGQGTYRFRD